MGNCSETEVKCHNNIDLRLRIIQKWLKVWEEVLWVLLMACKLEKIILFVDVRASLKEDFDLIWKNFRFSLYIVFYLG